MGRHRHRCPPVRRAVVARRYCRGMLLAARAPPVHDRSYRPGPGSPTGHGPEDAQVRRPGFGHRAGHCGPVAAGGHQAPRGLGEAGWRPLGLCGARSQGPARTNSNAITASLPAPIPVSSHRIVCCEGQLNLRDGNYPAGRHPEGTEPMRSHLTIRDCSSGRARRTVLSGARTMRQFRRPPRLRVDRVAQPVPVAPLLASSGAGLRGHRGPGRRRTWRAEWRHLSAGHARQE